MNVISTDILDVLILEPKVFGDSRGFSFESFNAQAFRAATGVTANFVQDNHSRSVRGVLRGLHYQVEQPQGKLVRSTQGEVLTSPSISAAIRRPSASGRARFCPKRTSGRCGSRWGDHELAIAWPFQGAPFLSAKDAVAPCFRDI